MPGGDDRDIKRRLKAMEQKEKARDQKFRNLENRVDRLVRARLDNRLKTAEAAGRSLEKRTFTQDKQLTALSRQDQVQGKKIESMEKSRAALDKRFSWITKANVKAVKKRIQALLKR